MQPCDCGCKWHPVNYLSSVSAENIRVDQYGVKHLKNQNELCIFTEKPIQCHMKCKFYDKKPVNKFGY